MTEQFSKMRYDVSKPGLLIRNYPELEDFREFKNPLDDELLKLAVLISDENSPFVKEKDYMRIVLSACDYLKITDNDFTKKLIVGGDSGKADKVRKFVHLLFTTENNWAYQSWYNFLYAYHESSLVIRTPLDPSESKYEERAKNKQVLLKQLPSMQRDLISYEQQIFPNSIVKQIVTQQTAKVTNWAEKMAKEQPVYKPEY